MNIKKILVTAKEKIFLNIKWDLNSGKRVLIKIFVSLYHKIFQRLPFRRRVCQSRQIFFEGIKFAC